MKWIDTKDVKKVNQKKPHNLSNFRLGRWYRKTFPFLAIMGPGLVVMFADTYSGVVGIIVVITSLFGIYAALSPLL